MFIIADTHVHIYPGYNAGRLITAAFANLGRLSQKLSADAGVAPAMIDKFLFLTERPETGIFFTETICNEDLMSAAGFRVQRSPDNLIAALENREGDILRVVAGRQFLSAEGLEVLALCSDLALDARPSAAELIYTVAREGGVPVLSWSPGKWSFGRKKVAENLLKTVPPARLLLGDISMRARLTPRPALFAMAEQNGFKIISGTDPLPLTGEEDQAGKLASIFKKEEGFDYSVASLRRLLTKGPDLALGARNSLPEALLRWLKMRLARS